MIVISVLLQNLTGENGPKINGFTLNVSRLVSVLISKYMYKDFHKFGPATLMGIGTVDYHRKPFEWNLK